MPRKDVREHYSEVARLAARSCDATLGEALDLYDAATLAGIPLEALAASRGCADPVARAGLRAGETVLDLGSGGGVDAIIASRLVGESGFVYGLDMTPEMVSLAKANASAADAANVEFLHGRIEDIPLPDSSVDVVVSNCVVNFSSDKPRVFAEAFRVLRAGGRIVVSDIVAFGPIPPRSQERMGEITGCTCGISLQSDYVSLLKGIGFSEVSVEPKTVYTAAKLREKAERKGRLAAYGELAAQGLLEEVDSRCGSAIICARA